ncbi:putative mucin-associated surface protein (MASP) [Trypanosoma cruzi Dm28c]|uniref:Putative mucin-associated surface protein (MASP) n=1 Tax=Trypanosoma cruzi Dm28c TaxID=1416333 RepID=V5BAI1_TRYCR|nr:putative mucin-associated surface protein (MASP) [Trypanosoma cruzi Dm28c]
MHCTHTTVCVDALLRKGACAQEPIGHSFLSVFTALLYCYLFTFLFLCVFLFVKLLRGVFFFCFFIGSMFLTKCCCWCLLLYRFFCFSFHSALTGR